MRREAAATAVRTPPPVRSKGVGGVRGPRQASPRALAIGGGIALVVVIAIVLDVVLGSSGGGGGGGVVSVNDIKPYAPIGSQNSQTALQGAAEANNLFKGIPQNGLVLGKPSAPVEMEMFIDVQCPICRDWETLYIPTIVQKYVKTGKLQLHLKPWAFLSAQSFTGRYGLIAASYQNKGFQWAKVLYDNQGEEKTGWLTGPVMAGIAASVTGLNMSQWQKDVNSSKTKAIAAGVDKLATQDKVGGTPTIFVGRANGQLSNVQTSSELAQNRAPTLQETEQHINSILATS
jgi:protein-disulfide isomerase